MRALIRRLFRRWRPDPGGAADAPAVPSAGSKRPPDPAPPPSSDPSPAAENLSISHPPDIRETTRRRQAEKHARRQAQRAARPRPVAGNEKAKVPRTRAGVRILTREDDIRRAFLGESEAQPVAAEPEPDFADLLDAAMAKTDISAVLAEKDRGAVRDRDRPVPARKAEYPPPQDEMDLHGATALEAAERVVAFIQLAKARRLRTVRIIVGKGKHSEAGPVLPRVAKEEIARLKREKQVFAFDWERGRRESGAIVVYL